MFAFVCTGDSDCTGLVALLLAAMLLAALAWASLFVVPAVLAARRLSPDAPRPRAMWFAASVPVAAVCGYLAVRTGVTPPWPVVWWMVLAARWRLAAVERTAPDGGAR